MRHLSIVFLTCLVVAGVAFAAPDAEPEHRALETNNNIRLTEKDIMPFLYWSLNQQQQKMSMANANRNRNQLVRGQKQPCDDFDEDLVDIDDEMTDDNLETDANVQPLDEDEDYMEEPEASVGVIEAYVDVKSGAVIISESAIKSILNGNYISLSDAEEEEDEEEDGLGKANKTVRRRRGKGKKRGRRRGNKRRRNNRRRKPIRISTRPRGQRVRYN
ncbi:hypothetical protein ACFFRR_002749 [Megaselia abdita]